MAVHANSVRGGLYWQLDTPSFRSSFHSSFHSTFHSIPPVPLRMVRVAAEAKQGSIHVLSQHRYSRPINRYQQLLQPQHVMLRSMLTAYHHQHLGRLAPHLWPLESLSLSWCTSSDGNSHVLWKRAITCSDGHYDGQPSYKHHRGQRGRWNAPYLVLDMCITTRGERNIKQMCMLVSRRGDKDEQEFEQARRELGLSFGTNEQVVSSA